MCVITFGWNISVKFLKGIVQHFGEMHLAFLFFLSERRRFDFSSLSVYLICNTGQQLHPVSFCSLVITVRLSGLIPSCFCRDQNCSWLYLTGIFFSSNFCCVQFRQNIFITLICEIGPVVQWLALSPQGKNVLG